MTKPIWINLINSEGNYTGNTPKSSRYKDRHVSRPRSDESKSLNTQYSRITLRYMILAETKKLATEVYIDLSEVTFKVLSRREVGIQFWALSNLSFHAHTSDQSFIFSVPNFGTLEDEQGGGHNRHMTRKQVIVVRTGTANIGSVMVGLQRAGAIPIVSAPYVMIPGVGSFGSALEKIKSSEWENYIKCRIDKGLPTMLICVGLQMLARESEESPFAQGLHIIDQMVTKFPESLVVPQQAWNYVISDEGSKYVGEGYAYFSNSYKMDSAPEGWTASYSHYGSSFIAAIERGNVLATQFHPELSGEYGISILRRWLGVSEPLSVEKVGQFPTTKKIPRIIPCLDIKGGQVVKGIKFQNISGAGDPAERAAIYQAQGADEIVVLDISATEEERKTTAETIEQIRKQISIPLCVGGGIRSVSDAERILEAGADKVAVNTAAVKTPEIITQMAEKFGKQCTVLSLDAALRLQPSKEPTHSPWEVVIYAGKERTGMDAVSYARESVHRGAGEILLTSWDRDGTKSGYDVELLRAVSQAVNVPVIASGGGSSSKDMADALSHGADAVLAASIFHYNETTVVRVKQDLRDLGFTVRLEG
ncbi:imidazole glycerol phosphate synthase subunit HisF [Planoprotostelium fungivorum]|uniref:Imidazole glycerol phosphate synthase subunit HisF n=1 Tax=Planoprotostelium fungivorum TaxID=1890364 RepID=A0A2P6NN30_9EUKA|nr:imidazole glycerol phosphate synthase subunit HisF [Planoprotostelium fungivorum]